MRENSVDLGQRPTKTEPKKTPEYICADFRSFTTENPEKADLEPLTMKRESAPGFRKAIGYTTNFMS